MTVIKNYLYVKISFEPKKKKLWNTTMISTELKKKAYFYIISNRKDSWVRLTLLRFYIHAFPVLLLVNRMKLKMLSFELQEYLLHSDVSNSPWNYIYMKSLEMSLCKIGHASISLILWPENNYSWKMQQICLELRCFNLTEKTGLVLLHTFGRHLQIL